MAPKVRTSGTVMPVSISDFTGKHVEELAASLGSDAEALIMKNKDLLGVFMSVEHRNAIAEAEDKLQTALLLIDMLAAGRTLQDVQRSADQVASGQVTSGEDFLAELGA